MRRHNSFIVHGMLAAGLLAGLVGAWALLRNGAPPPGPPRPPRPQCGHWCVLRCCELLGAPLDMEAVLQIMPSRPEGHTLLELANALKKVGFEVESRRESLKAAGRAGVPCIVHLAEPDHFAVLFGAEGDRLHLFDGAGQRKTLARAALAQRWSGNVMYVRRPAGSGPLPAMLRGSDPSAPCIQFDRLYADAGQVRSGDEATIFTFPFHNMGSAPLLVQAVKTGCDCMQSTKPEHPIPPGGTGAIELHFHPGVTSGGSFLHTAAVKTNDPHFPVIVLRAGGTANVGVYVVPKAVDLGDIAVGASKSTMCFILSTGDAGEVTVKEVASSFENAAIERCKPDDELLGRQWRGLKRVECGNCKTSLVAMVRVRVSSEGRAPGPFHEVMRVFTNIQGCEEIAVPIRGRFVSPPTLHPSVPESGHGD
jgi:hypothetical protein